MNSSELQCSFTWVCNVLCGGLPVCENVLHKTQHNQSIKEQLRLSHPVPVHVHTHDGTVRFENVLIPGFLNRALNGFCIWLHCSQHRMRQRREFATIIALLFSLMTKVFGRKWILYFTLHVHQFSIHQRSILYFPRSSKCGGINEVSYHKRVVDQPCVLVDAAVRVSTLKVCLKKTSL